MRDKKSMTKYIGISGAHRSGKTTLANMLSNQANYNFFPLHISDLPIWEKYNIQLNIFEDRLAIQQYIAQYMFEIFDKLSQNNDKSNIIFDRSPLDVIAYLLCNINNTIVDVPENEISELINDCIMVINKYFSSIIILQPSIPLELKNDIFCDDYYNNIIYRKHLTNTMIGLYYNYLSNSNVKLILIPHQMIDINKRLVFVQNTLGQII